MQLRKFLALSALALVAASSFGQNSAYYTTDGTTAAGFTHVHQGGALQFSYQWVAGGEMPIVIGNFGSGVRVRQAVGQPVGNPVMPGDEYLLNGTATGFQNNWNSGDPNTTGYDAGFNGTNIFMVDWGGPTDGGVYRYDNNYGSRTFMFQANPGDIGITYDSGNNTIWTSNFNTGLVSEWNLGGTQLFSFQAATSSAAALAFDTTDGTLWMSGGVASFDLYQYSRTGNLLQTVSSSDYVLGGEMVAVPEPATMAILGLGMAALLKRRRR